MEEYDAPGLLVATTNIEDSLDAALFRRFDDVFLIPLPGSEEIEQLLRTRLSAVAVSNDIDWRAIVKQLEGTSAAMVVKAAEDAAKAAVLEGKKQVAGKHLTAAIAEQQRAYKYHNGDGLFQADQMADQVQQRIRHLRKAVI